MRARTLHENDGHELSNMYTILNYKSKKSRQCPYPYLAITGKQKKKVGGAHVLSETEVQICPRHPDLHRGNGCLGRLNAAQRCMDRMDRIWDRTGQSESIKLISQMVPKWFPLVPIGSLSLIFRAPILTLNPGGLGHSP